MKIITPTTTGTLDKEIRPGCGVTVRSQGLMLATIEVKSIDEDAQTVTLISGAVIGVAQILDVMEPGDLAVAQADWSAKE